MDGVFVVLAPFEQLRIVGLSLGTAERVSQASLVFCVWELLDRLSACFRIVNLRSQHIAEADQHPTSAPCSMTAR